MDHRISKEGQTETDGQTLRTREKTAGSEWLMTEPV